MLGPVYLDILTFFYPIGNTPAVSLTRDLSPEQKEDVLLLGCGDARNILFTLYTEQNISRKLDITCCDIQSAVIARNILLLSLILADTDGTKQQMIWNVYYHFYLDEKSMKVLIDHAAELVSLSNSMSEWNNTKYGRTLRFCDLSTFNQVRALWKAYSMHQKDSDERTTFLSLLEASIQRARDVKEYYVGSGSVTTGVRSAAPLGALYAGTAQEMFDHYWRYGSTDQEPGVLEKTTLPNPLFAYPTHTTGSSTLHYGTDPLLGFHLAKALVPLEQDSTTRREIKKPAIYIRVVNEARSQFRAWCDTLRQSPFKVPTIRFFAGDAIAFAYALHQLGTYGNTYQGNIYRDAYHLTPIEFAGEYSEGSGPLRFSVIDTSNLTDHLGTLNVLTATSSLLKSSSSSILYTESLVKRKEEHKAYINSLLCGHFSTISLLLGLFPVEYWTNASSSSSADDVIFDTAVRLVNGGDDTQSDSRQMRIKLSWKSVSPLIESPTGKSEQRLRMDENSLANVLHDVYRNMFQHEDLTSMFKGLSGLKMQENSILYYHRGSFAAFLRLVRSRVVVDWQTLMNHVLRMIATDTTCIMGPNYAQELYLHLHILEIYSAEVFTAKSRAKASIEAGIGGWENLPKTVCITLKVPRRKLTALTGPKPTDVGAPIAHCTLQSSSHSSGSPWQNIFSEIRVAFGEISTVGPSHSNDFIVLVAEDDLRWQGNSPLVVSFLVPSWFLLLEPQTARIAFGLQSTPHTAKKLTRSLGIEMNIFETVLGDNKHVYISRFPPNITELEWAHRGVQEPAQLPGHEYSTTTTASVTKSDSSISSLCVRMDLRSNALKEALRDRSAVKTTQTAPCTIKIAIASVNRHLLLHFPSPVCGNKSKTRIARKSFYIEVEAPIDLAAWQRFPSFISPCTSKGIGMKHGGIHRVDMKILPAIDTTRPSSLEWLITHASGMFSGEERRTREQSQSEGSTMNPGARVGFKDSLFSLLMHFPGLQGGKSRIFGLDHPTGGGVHILILVSCMRLDVGSQTVVLDAAVLPLTKSLVARIGRFLNGILTMGMCSIKVDSEELDLWRKMLPLFAERCRSWQHKTSCEFTQGKGSATKDANNVLCSCGKGHFPVDFIKDIPTWDDVANFATRAAISPIFSVPVVDPPFNGQLGSGPPPTLESLGCITCGKQVARGGGKLLKCSACHIARYCSTSCQKSDWKKHKQNCNK